MCMAELKEEQKQAIEDYLSKEVAMTQAQKKAVEDYLSNRSDLSRAEKTRINSYLIKAILSILAVLGVTTLVAVPPLWSKMIENIKINAVKEVKDEVTQDLKDNDITREDLVGKAANLDGQFNLLLATIADIQNNVFTLQTSKVNQLGQSITKFTKTLGDQSPEGKDALAVVTELETRITALEESITPVSGSIENGCTRIGDIQVCWGSASKSEGTAAGNHVRCYDFGFAQPFASTPVVTNGINTQGDGPAFEVYAYELNNSRYGLCVGNVLVIDQQVILPVTMNYIAVGLWK
jgi:hypothetical protein